MNINFVYIYKMLYIYIFFILVISSKCRLYDDISIIQETVLAKMKKSNLSIAINGTNEFIYKLTKKFIYLTYNDNKLDWKKYIAQIFNPKFTILFNLSIYEYTNNIFDIKNLNNAILTDKLVTININLNLIKIYKTSEDFSFDVSYEIENITNNISTHFDNLNELDSFKYLFYEEKSFLYDNKTLNEHIKNVTLSTLINNTKNILIEYPDIDSFYYFKRLMDYGMMNKFSIDYYCKNTDKVITHARLTSYNFHQIIKNDTHLIFIGANFGIKLFYLGDMYIDYDIDDESDVTLKIDNITISRNQNYQIIYGKEDDKCNLEIFTNITERAKDQ